MPTPEHYLPLLHALALKQDEEAITYFNDVALAGSLTMTSIIIDEAASPRRADGGRGEGQPTERPDPLTNREDGDA